MLALDETHDLNNDHLPGMKWSKVTIKPKIQNFILKWQRGENLCSLKIIRDLVLQSWLWEIKRRTAKWDRKCGEQASYDEPFAKRVWGNYAGDCCLLHSVDGKARSVPIRWYLKNKWMEGRNTMQLDRATCIPSISMAFASCTWWLVQIQCSPSFCQSNVDMQLSIACRRCNWRLSIPLP